MFCFSCTTSASLAIGLVSNPGYAVLAAGEGLVLRVRPELGHHLRVPMRVASPSSLSVGNGPVWVVSSVWSLLAPSSAGSSAPADVAWSMFLFVSFDSLFRRLSISSLLVIQMSSVFSAGELSS